jgi:hypothetical protein
VSRYPSRPPDPWAFRLVAGALYRLPDGRVCVVSYVSESRARVHPITPHERVITVPDKRQTLIKGKLTRKLVSKEVVETGDPFDISPASHLTRVELSELSEAEFTRLENYVLTGGHFDE